MAFYYEDEMFTSWWYSGVLGRWIGVKENKVNYRAISVIPIGDKGITVLSLGANPRTYKKGVREIENIDDLVELKDGEKIPIYEVIARRQQTCKDHNDTRKNYGRLEPTRENVLRAFSANLVAEGQPFPPIKQLIQVDLMPTRTPDVKTLKKGEKKKLVEELKEDSNAAKLKKNFALLKDDFNNADYIFLGWGNDIMDILAAANGELYRELNDLIYKNYDRCYCFWITKAQQPVHATGGRSDYNLHQDPKPHPARYLRKLDSAELLHPLPRESFARH